MSFLVTGDFMVWIFYVGIGDEITNHLDMMHVCVFTLHTCIL